jgi:hypothetical protein
MRKRRRERERRGEREERGRGERREKREGELPTLRCQVFQKIL